MSDVLTCLRAAYKEVISFEPIGDPDSPGAQQAHGELLSRANTIIAQMYVHIQGVAAGSVFDECEEPLDIHNGTGTWGKPCICL
jgi:hypothetical protein